MPLADKTLTDIAKMAGLALEESEARSLGSELRYVLEHFEQLAEIPDHDEGVLRAALLDQPPMLRDDRPAQGLSREDLLRGAPRHDGDFLLVPKVLEDAPAPPEPDDDGAA